MFGQSGTCVNLWNGYSTLEVERNGSKDAEYESWIGWIPRNLHLSFSLESTEFWTSFYSRSRGRGKNCNGQKFRKVSKFENWSKGRY